jgi:hypothetical protein
MKTNSRHNGNGAAVAERPRRQNSNHAVDLQGA